ncbi:MAG: Rieske (2Fe-2S) protein [Dissulfuribacterales bacterium]
MSRRELLIKMAKRAWWLLFLYPLYRFLGAHRFRPPHEVRIKKPLSVGEHLVEEDFVLFQTENGAYAVSRTCTHLGCTLNLLVDEGVFACPCHQSRFTLNGKVIAGPAKKDLPLFDVKTMESGDGYIIFLPPKVL